MIHLRLGATSRALAIFAIVLAMTMPARAQSPAIPLFGAVIDSSTGLPVASATVVASGPKSANATTNRDGRFTFAPLEPGLYTLTASANGYQPAQSDQVTIFTGASQSVTLNLQRVSGSSNLKTIGSTSVRASSSLQKASVLYQQISPEAVTEQGLYRLGDALRQLPGVINGGSDTAAPADDINLNFRGIGNLETLTLFDGHPVGYGLQNPYNADISPAPLFGTSWPSMVRAPINSTQSTLSAASSTFRRSTRPRRVTSCCRSSSGRSGKRRAFLPLPVRSIKLAMRSRPAVKAPMVPSNTGTIFSLIRRRRIPAPPIDFVRTVFIKSTPQPRRTRYSAS